MDIFINVIIKGEILELKKVSRSMKVKDIKSYVELKAGIPQHLQRIQYLDNEDLDDHSDLRQSSIVGLGTLKVNVWKTWLGLLDVISRNKINNIFTEVGNDMERFQVAMYVAVSWGRTNVVTALGSIGYDINGQTPLGRTALHAAAVSGDCDLVSMLIEMGANINVKDKDGKKALNLASQFGNKDVERHLFLCHWKERTDKIPPWKDNAPLMMHQLFDSGYPTWKRGEYSQMYMSSELPPLDPSRRGITSLRGQNRHACKKDKGSTPWSSVQEKQADNGGSGPGTPRKERMEDRKQDSKKLPNLEYGSGIANRERKSPKGRVTGTNKASNSGSSPSSLSKGAVSKTSAAEKVQYNSDYSNALSERDVRNEDKSKASAELDTSKRKINLYEEWKYVPSFGKMFLEKESGQNVLMKI